MAAADTPVTTQIHGTAPGEKGLRGGSLGLMSSVVMGMASTAPAYSLAAALGFIVGDGGVAVTDRSCCSRSSRCT